jgi:formate dehydrogenase subunit gamma
MVATTRPSPEGAAPGRLVRFDRTERLLHGANATLFLTLIATGAALYVGPISTLVGRRELMRTIHVLAGVALPVPLLVTIMGPWGRAFRADVRRLSRWTPGEGRWIWTRGRDRSVPHGKFNPGQKLNASFTAGAIVVMLASGLMMRFPHRFADDLRTGATFVHDWVAFALFLTITGHILFAFNDRDSLRSIYRGWIPTSWAKRHAPAWHAEMSEPPAPADDSPGAVPDDTASTVDP